MRVEGGDFVEHGPDDLGGEVIRTHVDEQSLWRLVRSEIGRSRR
jgi:hypothetical protein